MLQKIQVQNYALIEDLTFSLTSNFVTITGETGAGKSILLSALGMLSGNRADAKSALHPEKKCVIEGVFEIEGYGLEAFFEMHDLDYDKQTIIRREITPAGKSRAFINDLPVTLDILQKLSIQLIDIHAQYDTQQIAKKTFQLKLLDDWANNSILRADYETQYRDYQEEKDLLEQWHKQREQQQKDIIYKTFILQELQTANLKVEEQTNLEEALKKGVHSEEIKRQLTQALQLAEDEERGILRLLTEQQRALVTIAIYDTRISKLHERIKSLAIEGDDIRQELTLINENSEYDPTQVEEINRRLSIIYDLQQKHHVQTVEELLALQQKMSDELHSSQTLDERIDELEKSITERKKKLLELAKVLSINRTSQAPKLTQAIAAILGNLGMEKAQLTLEIQRDTLGPTGYDQVALLFSANKGMACQPLAKIASGGERSRLMLAVKAIMAKGRQLPTLVLDEIDTGISGRIADQMGKVMLEMARKTQLIVVTHLPQIAAQGIQHLKIYKQEDITGTQTRLITLSSEQRVQEIAQMISGEVVSVAAIHQAEQLLK